MRAFHGRDNHSLSESPTSERMLFPGLDGLAIQKTGWKIKGADGAAELVGVKPTTLVSRIKKLGPKREVSQPPVFPHR